MTPERKAELIAEFERKHGPEPAPYVRAPGDLPDTTAQNIWQDMLRGWLQAHEDSDMAKNARRYRAARERAQMGSWEMEDGEPAIVVYLQIPDGIPSHWDAEEVFDAAIDLA